MAIIYIGDYLMRKVEEYRKETDSFLSLVGKLQKDGKEQFVEIPLTKARECARLKKALQLRMNRHFAITAKSYQFKAEYNNFPEYVKMENALNQAKITLTGI